MSIMDESLRLFQFKPDTTAFLHLLRAKAASYIPSKAIVDELYGLIPPLEITWTAEKDAANEVRKQLRQWNLAGLLSLKSTWDEFRLELFYSGSAFYVRRLQLCRTEMTFDPATPINLESYAQIQVHAERRLSLLADAFGNVLLRLIGVRDRLRDCLDNLRQQDGYPACLEILLRLISSGLREEEHINLDLFCDRARLTMAECIGYRAGLAARDAPFRTFLSSAASHKSHRLFEAFHPAVVLVWGCLANAAFMAKERREKGQFYFIETYYPNGRIEIGEILPAYAGDVTKMRFQFGQDCYKQVFSNYESAALFRAAALRIANP